MFFPSLDLGLLDCMYDALETIRGCLTRVAGFLAAESLTTRTRGKVPCIPTAAQTTGYVNAAAGFELGLLGEVTGKPCFGQSAEADGASLSQVVRSPR